MKKLLATILALVMALGLCSVSWADENNYVTIELTYGSNVSDEDVATAKNIYANKKYATCKAANEAYMALFGVTWEKGYLDVTDTNAPLYKYAGVSGSVIEVKFYIHGTLVGFTSLQSAVIRLTALWAAIIRSSVPATASSV